MSQSSAPPPSVAPGPDFCFDNYEESEVCQFAILRTRPPEEAVLHGGPGGPPCTSLRRGPSKDDKISRFSLEDLRWGGENLVPVLGGRLEPFSFEVGGDFLE